MVQSHVEVVIPPVVELDIIYRDRAFVQRGLGRQDLCLGAAREVEVGVRLGALGVRVAIIKRAVVGPVAHLVNVP